MERDASRPFRLSPRQEELWLARGDRNEHPAFRAALALRLRGALDEAALARALGGLVQRHEVLRTTYARRAGVRVPFQVVHETIPVAIEALGSISVDAAIAAASSLPFDLEGGPVLRAALARIAEDEHALLLSLPALAADAVSLGILAHDLADLYAGRAPAVEEPLQYADYAEYQQERAADKPAPAPAAAAPTPPLPFARRDATTFAPEVVPVALDARLDAATLFAAFQIVVTRFSGQGEIAIHAVHAGREDAELAGAIGLFARPVLVRAEIDSTATFATVADRARADLAHLDRAAHTVVPDDAILFEAVSSAGDREARGVAFSVARQASTPEPFGVALRCRIGEGGAMAELHYDASRFDEPTAARLAAAVAAVANAAARTPETEAGALPLLEDGERRALVAEACAPALPHPARARFEHLFVEQAKATPDRVALVAGDRRSTYAALDARTNQLARALGQRGVGQGARVGLLCARSADMIVGLLGILKAGAAYVPLSPDAPKARLAHQIADIGATVVVTQAALAGSLPNPALALCLDRDAAEIDAASTAPLGDAGTGDDVAYVIYTSGSTGTPKGVLVTHAHLVNYTHALALRLRAAGVDLAPGLAFATVSTLAADLGNTCIFPALATGGTLHVIAEDVAMDGDLFAAYAKANPIDVLKITPSHLGALLGAREPAFVLPRKALVTGGEAATWGLVDRVRVIRDVAWINHYGPTETTIGSLTFDLARASEVRDVAATVPIGVPLANTRAYVLDERRALLPIGVAGELFIAGAGVSRGYLNQPEQTAERFLPDPFVESGGLMYRTGDRVRRLANGSIEFLGRVDHQVKIRGYRVEPGEIEAALRKHTGVREAIVMAREAEAGDLRLVAYVVAKSRPAPAPNELRAGLAGELPEYMLPSAFVMLDALPLTPNGKVDRLALPAPDPAREAASAFVAPRDATETRIAAIWCELIGLAKIGVHDDFFELGGHSLLATQVVARVRAAFGAQISLRTLFERPTVAAFAEAVAAAPKEATADEVARVMAELEGLSDEEVAALLAAEQADA